jgi:DNA repair exonuclease SbcCD nuclease subunit
MNVQGAVMAGDIHLKPQTWRSRPDIQGDAYNSLGQIIDYCIEHSRSLTLLGDVFNSSQPDSQDVAVFRQGLDRMHAAGLPVYAIQGQHDWSDPPWPIALAGDRDLVQYVHGKVFEPLSGLPVYGLDRTSDEATVRTLLADIPPSVGAVAIHQLCREVFGLEGKWDFDTAWLPEHVNAVFAADYHEAVELKLTGTRRMWYTGSMYVTKIDEPFEKSFLDVTFDGQYRVQRVPLRTRPFIRIAISSPGDLDAAVRQLSELQVEESAAGNWPVNRPVVVVDYLTSVREVESRVSAAVGDRVSFWPRPTVIRAEVGSDEKVVEEENPELRTLLAKVADPHTLEFELVLDLFEHGAFTLDNKWRAKMGVA